jgi:hypothetical protein
VVIPQAIREALQLTPGEKFRVMRDVKSRARRRQEDVGPSRVRPGHGDRDTARPRPAVSGAHVVDSSGWLEYFAGTNRARRRFAAALEDPDHLIVPVLTVYQSRVPLDNGLVIPTM